MLVKGKLVKENEGYKIETEVFGETVWVDCTLSRHLTENFEEVEGKECVYRTYPYTRHEGSDEDYVSYLWFDIFKQTKETLQSPFFHLKVYVTGVYQKSEVNKENFMMAEVIVGNDTLIRKKVRLCFEDGEDISNIKETKGYNSFICTLGAEGKIYVVCKDEETRR